MRDLHAILEELLVLQDEIRQHKLSNNPASSAYELLQDAQSGLDEVVLNVENVAGSVVDMPERIDEAMHQAEAYSEKYER